jgi:Ferritin-like domain
MSTEKQTLLVRSDVEQVEGTSRRAFLQRAGMAGAVGATGIGSLLALASPSAKASSVFGRDGRDDHDEYGEDWKRRDHDILIAAEIAEALAVTTYTNIIDASPFFTRLPADDQDYLVAARQEEMSHYLLEQSVTDEPSPFKSFFYPKGMFQDAQTTLNILATLEDAFIAAYLVGVRHFSTPDLRVTAARIMGIESDHRTLARVLASDVAGQDGGPLKTLTGAAGVPESVDPPNNNGYERTRCWSHIKQAVAALTPFADITAAKAAGFDVSKSFGFDTFIPKLPTALGDFISFKGC